ncbi:MAG: penicillin-binding protein 2 [Cellvibrionales bacterium TMED49]|nr:penicillin-binding protein 2 [Porticoccaceae bacterium]OUU38285.1 MAG: penicillin-binding protein 2 [Cellvibrionales bacterium TMED49]
MNDNSAFVNDTEMKRLFSRRVLFASIVAIVVGFMVLGRYFDLQVNQHQDFVTQSNNNRVLMRPVSPPRGLIFDRNGELLADNKPTYNLTIVNERSGNLEVLLNDLRQLIEISSQDIYQFKNRLKRRKPYQNIPLKYNLSERERSILGVNSFRLNGAEVSAKLTRYYPQGPFFAHVIGYVGRINEIENRNIDTSLYRGTDSIGKLGIEKYYEHALLGKLGHEHVETNARGRVMRSLSKEDPIPGANLELYLDANLQRTAQKILGDKRAAFVAIEIKTGGILAMVSTPSYDPNKFVLGISQGDYSELVNSENQPLFNRAIRGQYPPGSTIKPMFGLIGLQNKIITTKHVIDDPGFFVLKGVERPWRDHNSDKGGHGEGIDLAQAIIESCDVYFYNMGLDIGIETLASFSSMFGIGQVTGIDLHGEQPGIMPSKSWKKLTLGEPWFDGDTINVSIGQGFMLATPLQLAVMTARIASRGSQIVPKLVSSKNGVNYTKNDNFPITPLDIHSEYWTYMHQAMRNVVHTPRGTAYRIGKDLNYLIAGKTGTAQVISIDADKEYDKTQIDQTKWDHALFIAFAPAEDPKIAMALIVENGGHGSSTAAPIARVILDAYFNEVEKQMLVGG